MSLSSLPGLTRQSMRQRRWGYPRSRFRLPHSVWTAGSSPVVTSAGTHRLDDRIRNVSDNLHAALVACQSRRSLNERNIQERRQWPNSSSCTKHERCRRVRQALCREAHSDGQKDSRLAKIRGEQRSGRHARRSFGLSPHRDAAPFDDLGAIQKAFGSAEGQAAAADVPTSPPAAPRCSFSTPSPLEAASIALLFDLILRCSARFSAEPRRMPTQAPRPSSFEARFARTPG